MGAPSATQFHNWTDRVAALLKLNLDGYKSELVSASAQSLARQVDGSGDPLLEAALMGLANAVDRHSLPERYYAALPSLCGRPAFREFATGLNAFLSTADGGSYTNLRAALADKSAVVHPLFAELVRAALSESFFNDSDGDITTVFAPNYQTRAPDRVYVGADGSLSEETVDAEDAGTADVTLFASDNDAVYIGSRYKFSQVVIGLSTLAGADPELTFEYWNGNAWSELEVTDNSEGLTRNDTIRWTVPSDWSRSNQDKGSNNLADLSGLYFLRLARTADTLETPPVGTSIRIVPQPVLTAPNGSRHLGVDQPPLAIVRITGTNTCVVESIAGVDYSRFAEPGVSARALTPIAQDLTFTLSYVDQAGNNDSKAQTAWTAPAALGTKSFTLNTGDTGVRSVRESGNSIVTTATEGVFEIYAAEARTPAL